MCKLQTSYLSSSWISFNIYADELNSSLILLNIFFEKEKLQVRKYIKVPRL